MTALNLPLTQNSAPVVEFRCLYTSDLRRKQKRWQDGRVKFHTFNKRVMVYDEHSNFVGDTHWREDGDFDEGLELELDRGGLIVQISDCVGRRDQDLSELLSKRSKEKEAKVLAKSATLLPSPRTENANTGPRNAMKPLTAILGVRAGPHSKATLLATSPYERRQQAQETGERDTVQPTKRRRVSSPPKRKGYAQNLTGAALTLLVNPHTIVNSQKERSLRELPKRLNCVKTPDRQRHDNFNQKRQREAIAQCRDNGLPSSTETRTRAGEDVVLEPPDTHVHIVSSDTPPVHRHKQRNNPSSSRSQADDYVEKTSRKSQSIGLLPEAIKSAAQEEHEGYNSEDTHIQPLRPVPVIQSNQSFDAPPREGTCLKKRTAIATITKRMHHNEQSMSALRIKSRPKNKMLHISSGSVSKYNEKIEGTLNPPISLTTSTPIDSPSLRATEQSNTAMDSLIHRSENGSMGHTRLDGVDHLLLGRNDGIPEDDVGIDYRAIDNILSRKWSNCRSQDKHALEMRRKDSSDLDGGKHLSLHEQTREFISCVTTTGIDLLHRPSQNREGSSTFGKTHCTDPPGKTSDFPGVILFPETQADGSRPTIISRDTCEAEADPWPSKHSEPVRELVSVIPNNAPINLGIAELHGIKVVSREADQAVEKESQPKSGAWTRESFDLFGDWKPKTT